VIEGRATLEGTRRFAKRSAAAPGHFREAMGLSLSSLGLGTYLGEEDEATDRGYEASIAAALALGVNVFDTAVNYRGQKSERAVGRALAAAVAGGTVRRDEVFVSTKGGYFPHDADDPREPRRYIRETFLDPGLAPPSEIALGCHCMAPSYLADQLDRSCLNLGLESIDLYYLHNIETQRGAVDRKTFGKRLTAAAAFLEEAAGSGRIATWGLATWDGLRAPPEHPEHLSLSETLAIAREAGGDGHHFRAVQLPFNLGMAQGLLYRSQETADGRRPALAAAAGMGLAAFGSASLLQGRFAAGLPEQVLEGFPECSSAARAALQFARSAPGLVTSLVGISDPSHARDDFSLSQVKPAEVDRLLALFQ
jgi:aryl-alcohol dehydrogenase-like predicted oxidoreductase